MTTPLLSVEELRIDYLTTAGRVRIVDGVSFTVGEGEIVGLAGESGSGKSTILKGILRLLQPPAVISGGRVLFRGEDVLAMDEAQLQRLRWKQISLVMQSAMNALNPILTIGEQIGDVLVAHEGRRNWKPRVAELLDLVGIDRVRMASYPHELSGGMRQRVVIAMALALSPPLVFMDEPTTALDVVVQKDILDRVRELQQQQGFSILFITHDLGLMMDLCTRIGVLYAGRLTEVAAARALRQAPQHPYTQGLMNAFADVHQDQSLLLGIPGSPPDPRNPPSGCRFHPRCPVAEARCQSEQPPFVNGVACWRA